MTFVNNIILYITCKTRLIPFQFRHLFQSHNINFLLKFKTASWFWSLDKYHLRIRYKINVLTKTICGVKWRWRNKFVHVVPSTIFNWNLKDNGTRTLYVADACSFINFQNIWLNRKDIYKVKCVMNFFCSFSFFIHNTYVTKLKQWNLFPCWQKEISTYC